MPTIFDAPAKTFNEPTIRLRQALTQGRLDAAQKALNDGADAQADGLLRAACEDARAGAFIELLLKAGARPASSGPDGLDDVEWACSQGYWLAARALAQSREMNFSGRHARAWGEEGKTLAQALAALGDARALERLIQAAPQAAEIPDASGFDPFWAACESASLGCAQALLPWTDPSRVYGDGSSPLHAAAALGSAELTRSLLARGANPCLADHQGQTPLHSAAKGGAAACCEALIRAGAPRDLQDDEGRCALELARRHGREEAAQALSAFAERDALEESCADESTDAGRSRL
jgi:ankyrin repeat protein